MDTIKKGFIYILITALALTGAYRCRTCRFQEELSKKVLRFHVLANSDSQSDQSVKLKVRDEIGRYMQEKLQDTKNLTECEDIAAENLPKLKEIARRVLAREGCDYDVDAEIAEVNFPVKQYGSYTFPAGKYQALQIVLGEGKGHNWWCVMYPNMCFSSSVYEVVDEDAKEELRAVLNEEEYEELMVRGDISVKFKYLEKIKSLLKK